MKINIFISVVKAISAWLHGEGSADFRAYTWPRIKQATRTVINLGIYEKIESFYRIVDDTYYKGIIDIEPQDPLEVARLEAYAAELDRTDGAVADAGVTLPKFSVIRPSLMIWKGLEQGNTFRCGTFSMNNMLRTAMLRRGLKPALEVTSIDPLYVMTKAGTGQTGTVMNNAFAFLAKKGFPMPSWTPSMTNHDKELVALESNKNVPNASLFSGIKAGKSIEVWTFDQAAELDRTLPMTYEMQVSISFCASLKYFGQLVPYLEKINGQYQFTRTGGHSVHGVRGSFSTWEDGDAGFAIIDSAYRSKEEGWRFLKANLFNYGMLSGRFVEILADGAAPVTPTPIPPTVPVTTDDQMLASGPDIVQNEDSARVLALQKFLMASGYAIPNGPTTFFGKQTQVALKNWQDAQFGVKYDGTVWGAISRQRYIEIKKLG